MTLEQISLLAGIAATGGAFTWKFGGRVVSFLLGPIKKEIKEDSGERIASRFKFERERNDRAIAALEKRIEMEISHITKREEECRQRVMNAIISTSGETNKLVEGLQKAIHHVSGRVDHIFEFLAENKDR